MDSSVQVSHLDRNEIIQALTELKGLVRADYSEEVLRKSLAFELKKRHPIHDKLKSLSCGQLFNLASGLSLDVIRRKDRMIRPISNYFFENFPEAPLNNLKRILEEDAYFDQLTSGKSSK